MNTSTTIEPLVTVREQLANANAAKKCHPCGCFQSTVEALASSELGESLSSEIAASRATFTPKKYDCLACEVCFPAIAANAVADVLAKSGGLDLCPTEESGEREGWPPLVGDYHVIRYGASVAVCTLNSDDLANSLATVAPEGLAIVGTMHTENLGIERVVRNVSANPNIRFLVLCGEDTQLAIGHLPGQSLQSLFHGGIDERQRIRGALGKRPVLKNVTPVEIAAFLQQIELVSMIGEHDLATVMATIDRLSAEDREPFHGGVAPVSMPVIEASEPARMVQDPSGYFVLYPDRRRRRIVLEHYTNDGMLRAIIEGNAAGAIYATAIERGLLSRLDHAAYLGRELARAAHALESGEAYVQDRAPEQHAELKTMSCGPACS